MLLRSYAVMGRSADAEEVFQLQVVRQYMKEVRQWVVHEGRWRVGDDGG